MKWLMVAASLCIASAAESQVRPRPGIGDPRLQYVDYAAEQVVEVQVAPGYQLTVELAPDERIENIAVGDSASWSVTPNKRGDHLFIKAIGAGAATNMVVLTDARRYAFQLGVGEGGTFAPYVVKFQFPQLPPLLPLGAPPAAGQSGMDVYYTLGGDKDLRPSLIEEDGEHVLLTFATNLPLPAVFAVDTKGQESLVNGNVRDGKYVIDGIPPRLLFRLDKRSASAKRVVKPREN